MAEHPYINNETAELVDALNTLIQSRDDLRDNAEVAKIFEDFKRIAATPPAIVEYIKNKTDPNNTDAGFTKEQIQQLMFATVARSSSTWGTIQAEAAFLGLEGNHNLAALVNENAKNETGDKNHTPHPSLLYQNIQILANALEFEPFDPTSYHLARQIHILNQQTPEGVEDALKKQNIHIPHTPEQLQTALHYCELTKPEIVRYHNLVMRTVMKLPAIPNEIVAPANIHDPLWKSIRALELAAREANSVDEHETGKLSYIGAYGLMVESLLGYVPREKRYDALQWTMAHNDEETGKAAGWINNPSAEAGHADDARKYAIDQLQSVTPEVFVAALKTENSLGQARLNYWSQIVDELRAKENQGEKITSKRTNDISEPKTHRKKLGFLSGMAAGAALGSALTASAFRGCDYSPIEKSKPNASGLDHGESTPSHFR